MSVSSAYSQSSAPPNTIKPRVTITPLNSWNPPLTNRYLISNVWKTVAGSAGSAGRTDGPNNRARFNQPVGLAINKAGELYVTDALNHTIRKISPQGTNWIVTTIAGTPGLGGSADGTNSAARFNQPTGITFDNAGDLFVTDTLNNTIRKLTPQETNWVVTTIAGFAGTNGFRDGTNGVARFNQPMGITVDNAGNLYVADALNETIRQLTLDGTNCMVKTIAGSPYKKGNVDGPRWLARFNRPTGITQDGTGKLFVADMLNRTIRQLQMSGTNWVVSTIAGQTGVFGSADGLGRASLFGSPSGITIDNQNNLYVADSGNHNIRKLNQVGTNWFTSTLGGLAGSSGTNDGPGLKARFDYPCALAFNNRNGAYYVADSLNDTIRAGGASYESTNVVPGRWVSIQTGTSITETVRPSH